MPPRNTAKQTSSARLSAVIKSARDTMRKDAGLNGDLDRLPQLSWLLFLRAFDAMETNREVWDDDFRPAIIEKYRWRAWAGDPLLTGDDLLDFVNDELLPHLRGLKAYRAGDPRNVLSALFKDIRNQMMSGFLLRDLLDGLQGIDFTSSDDIHTMAFLYESILKEVRDAAGDSGEFYTPRPVIRFMVEQSYLKLGESILDPACGTGGFLVEALDNLQSADDSTEEQQQLWRDLRGIEKKPLPYLLCMMNLILHGIETPAVIRDNALTRMLDEQGQKIDVVLTNPPFGGEEENSVAARFPTGVRTKETAWLFLYSVLTKLKPGGRCAIVLPNGVLFGDGAGAAIKERLMKECDLHTIVRLPQGVFAPYTQIPANLLFFDKTGPTKETWFYQIDPPEGRKGYSKTKPMRYEEFADCAIWWGGPERADRVAADDAWSVPIADIIASGYNLDITNPTVGDDLAHRPPAELLSDLVTTERQILSVLESLQKDLEIYR
jgi:type I restriction enzyme M protein